jgi:hypothetical protein
MIGFWLPCGVGEQRAHRLAIFDAELEDVTDFDAAHLLQHAVGVARGRVARLRDAQVRPDRFGEVAPPAHMNQVRVRLVRARDKVLQPANLVVGVQGQVGGQPHRSREADRRTCYLLNRLRVEHLHALAIHGVHQFVGVEFTVAAHQRRYGLAVHAH